MRPFLTPWKDGSATFPEHEPPPPNPEVFDGEEHFHVEAFRAKRVCRGILEHLVKWNGFYEEDNVFIQLSGCRKTRVQMPLRKIWMILTGKKISRVIDACSA